MKKTAVLILALLLLPATAALAQTRATPVRDDAIMFVDLSGGAMRPGGEVTDAYDTAPAFGALFAYRVARHFAVDGGIEVGFNASKYSAQYVSSTSGNSGDLSDYELMVPFGGQALLPIAKGQAMLSAGAGLAYLKFGEYGPGNCSNCGSRSGVGTYETVQFHYFPHPAFGLGITARFVQATTDGTVIGSAWTAESKDRWMTLLGSFSMKF